MHTSPRRFRPLQRRAFTILLITIIILCAMISQRYRWEMDWTTNSRHTLSPVSIEIINLMTAPLTITAYASNQEGVRSPIRTLIQRYQRYKPDLIFRFIDPYLIPAEVRARGIQTDGELLLEYQGRSEIIRQLSEEQITNALQRIALPKQPVIHFITGHGERSPNGIANHDVGEWAELLRTRGFIINTLSLTQQAIDPTQTSVLIIASPQVSYLAEEVKIIQNYIEAGGNLLWLLEPESLQGLAGLADTLGLTVLPTIIDPSSEVFGITQPTIVTISQYGEHAITHELKQFLTLFPETSGLIALPPTDWQVKPLMTTDIQAWAEMDIQAEVEYNEGRDIKGSLDIALAFTREKNDKEQRIIVIGDGDFLSNTYLQNVANADAGIKMLNWLAKQDNFISIPTKAAQDATLHLSENVAIGFGIIFLIALPFSLLGMAFIIWQYRQQA